METLLVALAILLASVLIAIDPILTGRHCAHTLLNQRRKPMPKYNQLTDSEQSTLTNGLRAAIELYEVDAAGVLHSEDDVTGKCLSDQFSRQQEQVKALLAKIDDSDGIALVQGAE